MLTKFLKIKSLSFTSLIPKFYHSTINKIITYPEIQRFLNKNQTKQIDGITLIPNENYPGISILTRLNKIITNSLGKENSELENNAIRRSLNAFDLNSNNWEIKLKENTQNVNLLTMISYIGKNGKIMSLNYYHGGNNIFGLGQIKDNFINNKLYEIDPQMGIVDMEKLYKQAMKFKPNLIFIGGNSYPRDWDYEFFKKISKKLNCLLMCDISQNYGLISSNLLKNPFKYCDIVTINSNILKSGIIYTKKKNNILKNQINNLMTKKQYLTNKNVLSIISNQMLEIKSNHYKYFSKEVIKNSKSLSDFLLKEGNRLSSNGTDTHLILWDCKPLGINGTQLKKTLELVNIYINKNSIVGDRNLKNPEGVLLGVYDITYRGIREKDIDVIGRFLMKAAKICQKYYNFNGENFMKYIKNDKDIPLLKHEVLDFVKKFPIYDSKY